MKNKRAAKVAEDDSIFGTYKAKVVYHINTNVFIFQHKLIRLKYD